MKVKYQLGFLCPQILFGFLDNKHQILCVCILVFLAVYWKVDVFEVKDYKEKVTPREGRRREKRKLEAKILWNDFR